MPYREILEFVSLFMAFFTIMWAVARYHFAAVEKLDSHAEHLNRLDAKMKELELRVSSFSQTLEEAKDDLIREIRMLPWTAARHREE